MGSEPIVLGVDVGTTNIKCYAYDCFSNIIGKADEKIDLLNLGAGRLEIVPDDLWENFKKVVNNCLISSHLHASKVACLGISTQRGTFLTWNKETGEPYHNFITWKDTRADGICNQLNSSILVKLLRFGCFLSYILTRKTKFQIFSALKFSSAMVLMRLFWILEHFTEIRPRSKRGEVLFGTIDTWLVWKLTGGKVHATDGSNACVTGFFDPFKMQWIDWILKYFKIPKHILPVVKDTCDSFGETLPNIFGSSIPICCLVGDQQASTFGACCFKECDVNCTMGTGSFLTINTGNKPSTAYHGIVPLIGWTIRSKTTYLSECRIHDTGPFITWMKNLGFFRDPAESSDIARSVSDSGGVYFLPAHNILKNSETLNSTSFFVGLKTNTSREQIVRSVLESLAFQVCLLFEAVCRLRGEERNINTIRLCGGVAKNDFVAQVVSDITARPVHRLKHNETSSLGAALLAGLHCGIWKTLDDLTEIQTDCDVFNPNHVPRNLSFWNWKKILKQQGLDNFES